MRTFLPTILLLLASAPLAAQVILDPAFGAGHGHSAVSFEVDAATSDSARAVSPVEGTGCLTMTQASRGSGVAFAIAPAAQLFRSASAVRAALNDLFRWRETSASAVPAPCGGTPSLAGGFH